jgi:hypothetical protein
VVPNGHPSQAAVNKNKRGDDHPYTRARQQTGRADSDDAVIEPAGLSDGDFFDQPENYENQQPSCSVTP